VLGLFKLYAVATIVVAGLGAIPAHAIGTPCDELADTDAVAAVAAARGMFNARWLQTSAGWGAAFKFKTEPRNPFALKAVIPDLVAEPPIEGFVTARSVTCSVYEVGAPRAYVVRFVADGLRFNENGAGWTRPIPLSVIMIAAVELRGESWIARDLPDARTAIPPFAGLRHPEVTELAAFDAVKTVPRKLAGGRK
jgi:hypothetical protein